MFKLLSETHEILGLTKHASSSTPALAVSGCDQRFFFIINLHLQSTQQNTSIK
jgi:hypothetical protein